VLVTGPDDIVCPNVRTFTGSTRDTGAADRGRHDDAQSSANIYNSTPVPEDELSGSREDQGTHHDQVAHHDQVVMHQDKTDCDDLLPRKTSTNYQEITNSERLQEDLVQTYIHTSHTYIHA